MGKQNVYLNAEWYKICQFCQKVWCSIKSCDTPKCPCLDAITVEMIRNDEVRFVTCGTCEKKMKDWLERVDPKPVKQLKGRTIRIEEKKPDRDEQLWDDDDAEAQK